MKKVIKFFGIFAACSVILTSCDWFDTLKLYNATFTFTPEDNIEVADLTDITLIVTGPEVDTLELNSLAPVTDLLVQGQYTATLTARVKDDATAQISGYATFDLFEEKQVNIDLSLSYKSPLVFKTIYSTGGAQYYVLDSYVEIVNNSDEVQYLDGLMLACPLGNLKQESAWQVAFPDKYNSGQGAVLAFPGNGTDYPLQPGEFIVLADQAMNHKLAYGTDESKKEEYQKSPDLSGANWEKYYGNGDTDNENVPNMKVVYTNNKSMKMWAFGVTGRAYMLIRLPEGMTPEQFAADENNYSTTPNTSATTLFMLFPSKYVLDAVDIYGNGVAAESNYPFFLAKDDAKGVEASPSYAGKCVRRKVEKIVNGRVYYKDSNNSSVDFKNNQDNTPGLVPNSID